MLMYDPLATRGARKIDGNGFVVHTATGELRRLPFHGASVMPLCFLADRHEVLVSGTDPFGGTGLVKIDLRSLPWIR
jgi:hypothetical protein